MCVCVRACILYACLSRDTVKGQVAVSRHPSSESEGRGGGEERERKSGALEEERLEVLQLEVLRLRQEVAVLEKRCATYEKEAKKLKFYMSTLPLPLPVQ